MLIWHKPSSLNPKPSILNPAMQEECMEVGEVC